MTKVKTKKIVKKRFKITKNGKVMHRSQGARHLRSRKNKARQRRQDAPHQITNTRIKTKVKRFLET